ncbi:MAG: hypothetical protein LBI39_01855 [Puniceicoccales bacterium]|nr:hypothetical protein [Puniceicoccales bacterium]
MRPNKTLDGQRSISGGGNLRMVRNLPANELRICQVVDETAVGLQWVGWLLYAIVSLKLSLPTTIPKLTTLSA